MPIDFHYLHLANNYIKSNLSLLEALENNKGKKNRIDSNIIILQATAESDLQSVRSYLDSIDVKMPKPKYSYTESDINTWKFLDGDVYFNKEKTKFKYTNVYNPNFKYGSLV